MITELKVFASASIAQRSGRCTLGQQCKILLNACHKDRWAPEWSAIMSEKLADFALDISLLHKCVCLVRRVLFSAVGFLRQTRSRYMSFRSHDVRIHQWVWGLGGDHFGNMWGMEINDSAGDIVILLSQITCIGFRITNQFRIRDSASKASMLIAFNFRYVIARGTVQLCSVGIFKFSVSRLTQKNLLRILEYYLSKISPSAHIYQQAAAHALSCSGSATHSSLPWSG